MNAIKILREIMGRSKQKAQMLAFELCGDNEDAAWFVNFLEQFKKSDDIDSADNTGYYINHKDGSKYEITGEETITAYCPNCQKEFSIVLDEFLCLIGKECDITSRIWCDDCSARRKNNEPISTN